MEPSSAEEFVEGLLNEDAHKPLTQSMTQERGLPDWYDEEKFNNGRRFFWDYCFGFGTSMVFGLVALMAVPSVLEVLMMTRRSSSAYTAYCRYRTTIMHVFNLMDTDLKPGTKSWQSFYKARCRHLSASKAAVLRGAGRISQRDLALTLMSFIGFGMLKPDHFGIRQRRKEDWEGYNHLFRTVGYMTGLEDRYNICRKNIDETREVCRLIHERVFAPCLGNVPEYYEHMARAMLDGLSTVDSNIEASSMLYWVRYLADVPGYVYTEADRIEFQKRLKEHLNGKADQTGVDAASLMHKNGVSGSPSRPPRYMYFRDFDCIESVPAYKQLNFAGRYHLALINFMLAVYKTEVGRYIINLLFRWNNFIATYFPYKAFFKFGVRESYVSMERATPKDDTKPKPNSEYERPQPPDTWYGKLLTVIW